MTKTQIFNIVFHVVIALAALATYLPDSPLWGLLPATAKPWIAAILGLAVWIKSQWNLGVAPDGQPLHPKNTEDGHFFESDPKM